VGVLEVFMKNGICPKCNSKTVHTIRKGISFGTSNQFFVRISSEMFSKSLMEVDDYICTTCGYFETYIEDRAKLDAVAKDWKKVG
jgi:DNA-directed RNA polymerase subunit RPC12/RpoP